MKLTLRNFAAPLALSAVAALVQTWLVWHAATPAQDAVRFVACAQAIERDGAWSLLRSDPEQPLFPLAIAGWHAALTGIGWCDLREWGLCSQVAAAVPLVLAVPLVYFLARRTVGARCAFIAGLMFVALPAIARLGADGLSDSTHLVCYLAAVGCITSYLNSPRAVAPARPFALGAEHLWLAAGGVCIGAALMARIEAIVLAPATVAAAALAAHGGWKTRAPRAVLASLAVCCGAAAVLVPYLAACDALRPRAAAARLVGAGRADESRPLNDAAPADVAKVIPVSDVASDRWNLADGRAMSFARKDPSQRIRRTGWTSAALQLGAEMTDCLRGAGLVLLVWGWRRTRGHRPRLRAWFSAVTVLHLGCVLCVGATRGYLSERHLIPWVAMALPWAAAGAWGLGEMTLRVGNAIGAFQRPSLVLRTRWTAAAACALVAGWCFSGLARPLHSSRLGHRLAAEWVRQSASPSQAVLDTRGWTALYSGRKTYRYELAKTAFSDPQLAYLVLEEAELASSSPRGESLRQLLHESADRVGEFPTAGSDAGRVIVLRWRPHRFALARGR